MQIGKLTFSEPFISLAPLAGYGDLAFRRVCRAGGASLTVTEMVSAKGLVYGNDKTEALLRTCAEETPSCVQLFGGDPEDFRAALRLPVLDGFDIIDVNMGCPVPKVTRNGEGSALMRDPARASDIVRACVESGGGRPVTVKHRLGVQSGEYTAVKFARACEDAGAAMLTVHGRTAAQGYSGTSDWEAIAEVARAVSVPVVGNGDLRSRKEALEHIARYGVAGAAIGRAAVGNPYIFAAGDKPSLYEAAMKQIAYACEYLPEEIAVTTLRKHMTKYLSGLAGSKGLRAEIFTVTTRAALQDALARGLEGGT